MSVKQTHEEWLAQEWLPNTQVSIELLRSLPRWADQLYSPNLLTIDHNATWVSVALAEDGRALVSRTAAADVLLAAVDGGES
jgi:hypothetical protein